MLFPTIEFALFFLVTFAASWSLQSVPTGRKLVLTIASYFFYGYWNWRYTFLLFECTAVNYVLALWLESLTIKGQRKKVLIGGIVFNLALLGYFKYWGFFLSSVNDALIAWGLARDAQILDVLLPAGVSFFTFQALSYLVDVYRDEIKAVRSPLDMLLFKSFFPQLVAGPIVRAKDFLPQLAKPVDAANIRATRAFFLIGIGLFKKIVIAHHLAVELVNPVFESPSSFSSFDLLIGVYGYAVQIYCDFSAYTDMAIGTALLFGYEFPVNFNQPYRAQSLQDFWRRWHISLSSWLRDYLYIPLGGSRGGSAKGYRNMFITMLLGGLWHGAAWNFVVWGVLHGVGQVVEKALRDRGLGLPDKGFAAKCLRTIVVFHFICLTWIFFAAESTSVAFEFLRSFGNITIDSRMLTPFTGFLLVLGFAGQFAPAGIIDRLEVAAGRIPLVAQAVALALVVLTIGAVGPGALAPFIYFRF